MNRTSLDTLRTSKQQRFRTQRYEEALDNFNDMNLDSPSSVQVEQIATLHQQVLQLQHQLTVTQAENTILRSKLLLQYHGVEQKLQDSFEKSFTEEESTILNDQQFSSKEYFPKSSSTSVSIVLYNYENRSQQDTPELNRITSVLRHLREELSQQQQQQQVSPRAKSNSALLPLSSFLSRNGEREEGTLLLLPSINGESRSHWSSSMEGTKKESLNDGVEKKKKQKKAYRSAPRRKYSDEFDKIALRKQQRKQSIHTLAPLMLEKDDLQTQSPPKRNSTVISAVLPNTTQKAVDMVTGKIDSTTESTPTLEIEDKFKDVMRRLRQSLTQGDTTETQLSSFPLHQEAKNAKIVAESTLLLISAREEEQQQLKTPPKVSFASSPDHYETQRDSPFIASLESNEDTGILTRKMSESKSSPADVARCKVKLKETLQTVKPTLRNTNVSDAHLFHNVEGKDLTSPLRSYSTTESLLLIPTSGEDVKVNSPLRVSNASNHDPHSSRRDIPLVAPLDSESAKQASSPRTISNLKRSSLVISHDNEKVKESLQRLRPTTENADISNPQSIHSLERRVGKRASKAKQKKNATINDTDSLHQEMESDKVNSDSSLVNSPSEKDNAKAPLKILLLSESGHRRSRRNSPLVTPLDANMATLTFKRRQPSESKSLPIVALSNGNEEIQKVLQNARSTSTKAEVLESHFIQDLGERAGISPLIASQVSVPVIIDKGIPHQEIKHEKIVSEYPPLGKSAKREVRVIRAARKASFLCDTGISGTRRVNPLVTLSDSDIAKQKQKTIPISVLKTSYIPTSNIKGGTEEKLQKISTATKPDVSETHSFPSLEGKVGKSPLKAKQKMGQTLIDNNHLHQEVDNGENANVPFASGRVIRETSQNSPFVTLNDPETMKETQQPSRTRNILSSSTLLSLPFPRSPLRESDGVSPLTVESRLQHRGTTHAGGDLNQQTRVSLEEGVAPITRSESPTLDHRLEKAYTLFPAKEWSLPFKSSLISLTLQGTKPPDVRSQNVRDQGKLDSVERDSATATLCQAQEIIGINQATNDEGVEASVTTKKETTDLVPSKFQPTSIFRPFTFPSNNGMAKMRAPTVTELVDVVTTVPFISDCESKGDLPEDGSDSDVSSLYSDMDAWSAPSFATEELEYRPRKQGVTQKISTARSPVKWGQVERKHLSQPQGDLAHHSSVRALSKSWLRDVDLENIPRYQLPNTSIGRRSLKLSPDNDEDILRREGEIPTKISRDNAPIVASASDVKVGGVVRKGWFTPSLASEQLVKKSPNQNVSDYEATRSQVRHSPPGDDGFGCKERKAFSDSLLSDNAIMAKPSVQESPILSWFGLASSIVLFRKSECDKKTTEILEPRLKTDALLKQVLPPPALIPPSPVQILFPAVAENSYASEGEPDEIFDIAMTNSDSVSDEALILVSDEVSLKHDPLALIPFTPVQILSPKLAENSVTSEGEPDEILEFAMTNHNSVSDEVIVVLDSDEVSLKHDPLACFGGR